MQQSGFLFPQVMAQIKKLDLTSVKILDQLAYRDPAWPDAKVQSTSQ